jgi:hypothetical protein
MGTSYDNENAKSNAELAGILAMGGGIAKSGLDDFFISDLEAKVKRTRNWDEFLKKLQPGDIMLERASPKGQYAFPGKITTEDILLPLKGSPFYHAGIYGGKGNVMEAADMIKGVKSSRILGKYPKELKVYRAKNPEFASEAIKYAKSVKGMPYETLPEQLLHVAGHWTGADFLKKWCGGKNRTTCTGLVTKSFPDLFESEYMSPKDIMKNEGVDLVARYGKLAEGTLGQKVMEKGIYPAMKSMKYAAPLALAAYMLSSKEKENANRDY